MLSGMSDGASEDCTSFSIIPHFQAQQHIQRFYHHLTIPTIPPVQKKLPTLNNTTFSLQLLHSVGVALQVTSVLASLTKLMMWLILWASPQWREISREKLCQQCCLPLLLPGLRCDLQIHNINRGPSTWRGWSHGLGLGFALRQWHETTFSWGS
jgi:hypothetical protein